MRFTLLCRPSLGWNAFLMGLLLASVVSLASSIAVAQQNNNNPGLNTAIFQQPVGGVAIDANGLLANAGVDAGELKAIRAQVARGVPGPLNKAVPLRSISLRRVVNALEDTAKNGRPISEDLAFLGGLQRIRYVFVYPEQQDIVLVGPAEGWKVDSNGYVVGITSGQSVMLLDDLIVAIRAANKSSSVSASESAPGGITCSIDPTAEGLKQLRTFAASLHVIGDQEQTAAGIEQALGEQKITLSGVPATSHLARVLVSADYRMKRLAMKFDPTPVAGMPSFLDMLSGSGHGMSNMMQRWWLEPTYDSILKSPDSLAWEFAGAGVKCMTEDDFLGSAGDRKHQAHANPLAQRWANNMTRHYKELAMAEPIFGELRNCMELAMVGTLLARENLASKAGCDLAALREDAIYKPVVLSQPTHVDSKVSMLKKGQNWVISASGGVMIRPAELITKAREDEAPAIARSKDSPSRATDWFWN